MLQLDLNLERLRMAVDDLLIKLAKMFPKTKLQIVFLINNYDMTISILKVRISVFFSGNKIYFFCVKVGTQGCQERKFLEQVHCYPKEFLGQDCFSYNAIQMASIFLLIFVEHKICNVLWPSATVVFNLLVGFQEAAPEGKIQVHFEELLKSNTALFVVTLNQQLLDLVFKENALLILKLNDCR